MTLEDELNRIFKIQNQFSNKLEAYRAFKNISADKVMEKFYKKNYEITNVFDAYMTTQTNTAAAKVMESFNINNEISFSFNKLNNLLNNSFVDNYKLPNYLFEFQRQNSSIFEIFEKQEFIDKFIEEFLRENLDNYQGEVEPQEEDLNIFGEMIKNEIEIQHVSSQNTSSLGYSQIRKDVLFVLFIILTFLYQNLDYFKDIREAIVFFINQIDCKGVTISRINLRSEPSFSSEVLIPIPKNSVLIIYDQSHNGWVKVKVNLNNIDIEGYVSEAYIRRLK